MSVTGREDPKLPSLTSNFSWTFLGNVTYAGSQWLLLIVLARLGSQTDLGQYALATAVSAPVFIFSNLKLRSIQAADALNEYEFSTYFSLRLITSVAALLVILLLSAISDYGGAVAWVVISVAVAKGIESISDILFGLLQRHEHMDAIAKSMMIKGLISIGVFTAGIWGTHSVLGGVIGLIIAWTSTLLIVDFRNAVKLIGREALRPVWDLASIRQLALLAWPLGSTVAINSLAVSVPRFFIEGILTTEHLGVFAAISYIMVAGSTVIAAIGQSATPRLARLYRTGNVVAHYRLTLKLLLMGATVGLLGILIVALFGRQILDVAYGHSYVEYNRVFLWVMVNAFVGYAYVFLGTALTSMKKFRIQLPVHVVGLVILIFFCWILVPDFELIGAVWAMIISNCFQASAYAVVFLRIFRGNNRPIDGGTHNVLD